MGLWAAWACLATLHTQLLLLLHALSPTRRVAPRAPRSALALQRYEPYCRKERFNEMLRDPIAAGGAQGQRGLQRLHTVLKAGAGCARKLLTPCPAAFLWRLHAALLHAQAGPHASAAPASVDAPAAITAGSCKRACSLSLRLQGVMLRRTKQSQLDGKPIIDLPPRKLQLLRASECAACLRGWHRCLASRALACLVLVPPWAGAGCWSLLPPARTGHRKRPPAAAFSSPSGLPSLPPAGGVPSACPAPLRPLLPLPQS